VALARRSGVLSGRSPALTDNHSTCRLPSPTSCGMDIELELLHIRRRLRRLQIGAAGLLGGIVLLLACGAYRATATERPAAPPSKPASDELTLQRLNIVEPDGTLRVVVSNRARAPDPVIGGKPVTGRMGGNQAGLVFYDENGNESGGLIYGGTQRDGAGSWFAFDRHDQDQTLGIGYSEGPGGEYESGVYVWDRPDATSAELQPKHERLRRLPAGPERDALIEQMRDNHELERFRAFFGRDGDGTATVLLSDGEARPRLRLRVGPDDEPRIEFLDANGKVTYSLSGDGPAS
jgi:hypothetical protein